MKTISNEIKINRIHMSKINALDGLYNGKLYDFKTCLNRDLPMRITNQGADIIEVKFQTPPQFAQQDTKKFMKRINSIKGYSFSGFKNEIHEGFVFETKATPASFGRLANDVVGKGAILRRSR